MVILIALLHGLPIFFVAWKSDNKVLVWLVAAICTAVAVMTGNPTYTLADLTVIALSLWNCLKVIDKRKAEAVAAVPVSANPRLPSTRKGPILLLACLLGLLALALLGADKTTPTIATVQPTPTAWITRQPSPAVTAVPRTHEDPKPGPPKAAVRTKVATVESCLKIPDEQRMVRCLEVAK